MNFEAHSVTTTNKIIPVRESGKRRELRIHNPDQVSIKKVTVDGGLIDDARPRCDYLLEFDDSRSVAYLLNGDGLEQTIILRGRACVIYLELKGEDIRKAYKQLEATMGYAKVQKRHKGYIKICYIIVSRVSITSTELQKFKRQMAKKKTTLAVQSKIATVTINKQ